MSAINLPEILHISVSKTIRQKVTRCSFSRLSAILAGKRGIVELI